MVHSLWFRTTSTGHIFIHPVFPTGVTLLEIYFALFAATSISCKSVEAFPFSPTWVSTRWEFIYVDKVIDEGRLADFLDIPCLSSLMLVAFVGLTALRKLFLYLSWLFAGSWPNRGCRSSVDCQCRSLLLATLHRISGGAIMPERMQAYSCRLSVGVGLRQSLTRQQVGHGWVDFLSVSWSFPYRTCIHVLSSWVAKG